LLVFVIVLNTITCANSIYHAYQAVQALWISPTSIATNTSEEDDILGAGGPTSLDFLWSDAKLSSTDYALALLTVQRGSTEVSDEMSGGHKMPNNKWSLASNLTFTSQEFRLVCAQMIPSFGTASGNSLGDGDDSNIAPVRCVQNSLRVLISTGLDVWRESVAGDMRVSIREALRHDFPIDAILGGSDGASATGVTEEQASRVGSNFLKQPPFRLWWTIREVDLGAGDDNDEDGSGSGVEKLGIPRCPSAAISAVLRAAGKIFHTSFLSADTTYVNPYRFGCGGSGSGNDREKMICLADLARHVIYGDTLRIIIAELTAHHNHISKAISKTSTSTVTTPLTQLFEDYCLQMVFDLSLCESTLHTADSDGVHSNALSLDGLIGDGRRSGNGIEDIAICKALWSDTMDPINTHLLLPLVTEELNMFVKGAHLLLPHAGSREKLRASSSGSVEDGGDRGDNYSDGVELASARNHAGNKSKSAQNDIDHNMSSLFATGSSSGGGGSKGHTLHSTGRFLLLPLPLNLSEDGDRSMTKRGHVSGHSESSSDVSGNVGVEEVSATVSESGGGVGLSNVFKGFGRGWT
jgi:hypothetical protein